MSIVYSMWQPNDKHKYLILLCEHKYLIDTNTGINANPFWHNHTLCRSINSVIANFLLHKSLNIFRPANKIHIKAFSHILLTTYAKRAKERHNIERKKKGKRPDLAGRWS